MKFMDVLEDDYDKTDIEINLFYWNRLGESN